MRHSFQVKVCGITRAVDARNAVALGADMLGFIFYRRSPRWISLAEARKITAAIPPTIARVGVFVNEAPALVLMRARKLRLDYVQLSGEESNREIKFLQREGLKVIKSFYPSDAKEMKRAATSPADIILLDNRSSGLRGGTGKRFDWNVRLPGKLDNLMLSGGISSKNVAEGVKRFKPLVVDVNSGVETRPGIKSKQKLIEFFKVCNRIRYGR